MLTGILREQCATLAVDDFLNNRKFCCHRMGRDQTDASHHGIDWGDDAKVGVKTLYTDGVWRGK